MRAFARSLARNLAAGLRLALFLPVRRLAFRADVPQLLALLVVSALVDIAADAMRYGGSGVFSWYGLGSEVGSGGILLLSAAVLALVHRDRSLTLAIPVIALAAFPLLQIANGLPWASMGVPAAWVGPVEDAVLVWILATLVRIAWVAFEYRGSRRLVHSALAGVLLAAPIFFSSWFMPVEPWFAPVGSGVADPNLPNPASEPVLTEQARILDDALADLDDGRPGVTDLYFVGFAGDPAVPAFRSDVNAARAVMDERWDTGGRSIALVNDPRTLLANPIATLSNLRDTLAEIGAAMDADEDIAMVYLAAGRGADGSLVARLPPLELVPISAADLRRAFDDADIRYRVIVVSACDAGDFIDELADDDTAVVVASRGSGSGDDCGANGASAAFGEAFFGEGMHRADRIDEAFERARKILAERAPSLDPAIRIGPGIAARLADLRRRGGAQREARRTGTPTG